MTLDRDRLELSVTYVAPNVELGVRLNSIEFIDDALEVARDVTTVEGHVKLAEGSSFYINKDEFGMGRSISNDLFIDSPKVSRSHAKIISCPDESYQLLDTSSANGTALNGKSLTKNEECKLSETGEIQLAGVFHIKFTDFGATDVTPETITLYGLTLSHAERRVWMQGSQSSEAIKLSNSEYKFLNTLMGNYPDYASHKEITLSIWGWEPDNPDDEKRIRDALFNIVKRLRERLEQLDSDYEYIETVRKWGEREGGYKFNKN